MKKVGIITICDPQPNYGNRLQNYAVQYVLNKLGYDVETLSIDNMSPSIKLRMKSVFHKLTLYFFTKNKSGWKLDVEKKIRFDRFNKKFITISYVESVDSIPEKDYYIVGSDQVWNDNWYNTKSAYKDYYLLSFTQPEKKVCFSPSFGVENISREWKNWFSEKLALFNEISVREETGARIVKTLTGKEAEVLIDPTMMLDSEEWLKISKCPRIKRQLKKYILTYFLGGKNELVSDEIKKIAEEKNLAVYNLQDKTDNELYTIDPSEFIYLISNAELIATDSFHACVFSILFNKPFIVYERQSHESSMSSRIDDLLNKFKLNKKGQHSLNCSELFEHNYHECYDILKVERTKVIDYLNRNMNN